MKPRNAIEVAPRDRVAAQYDCKASGGRCGADDGFNGGGTLRVQRQPQRQYIALDLQQDKALEIQLEQ